MLQVERSREIRYFRYSYQLIDLELLKNLIKEQTGILVGLWYI